MIIGFDQRWQNVSENAGSLSIHVSTMRTSERNHTVVFHYQKSSNTAVVRTFTQQDDPEYDALFGTRQKSPEGSVEEIQILTQHNSMIPPLLTAIRNDDRPEDRECYTISIITKDIEGVRELFTCKKDVGNPTDFFCDHTICIDDDDGQFTSIICVHLLSLKIVYGFVFF